MTKPRFQRLGVDPIPALRAWDDPALAYWVRRDLLEEAVGPIQTLWEMDGAQALVRRQQAGGEWRYPAKNRDLLTGGNYDLLETYRGLRILVDMYAFDRSHPALQKAAEYIFTCQTSEGDLRGILGNQYMPYYMGAILELLIKAGYADDERVQKGLEWLLSMRQQDGGWIIPTQAVPSRQRTKAYWQGKPIPPERSRPFSHLATGMVLRAFAAHPGYRARQEILQAARGLKSRFFQADKYTDRRGASYWLKFQFPFWWTSLLTALDSLARMGFGRQDEDIARGLEWFRENQSADGLWETGYGAGRHAAGMRAWVGLAACRMWKVWMAEGIPAISIEIN